MYRNPKLVLLFAAVMAVACQAFAKTEVFEIESNVIINVSDTVAENGGAQALFTALNGRETSVESSSETANFEGSDDDVQIMCKREITRHRGGTTFTCTIAFRMTERLFLDPEFPIVEVNLRPNSSAELYKALDVTPAAGRGGAKVKQLSDKAFRVSCYAMGANSQRGSGFACQISANGR